MTDYPLLHLLWQLLLIFGFIIWFWLLITVFSDLFRRHDISGGKKVLWVILLFVTNLIGILIYLIVNGHGMAERNQKAVAAAQKQFDDHVKDVAGGSAAEIAQAKGLLDSGAITQDEFDAIKKKALS
ncbi:MAG: SHOCT domain-containing protein [Gaiellales bacterium]